MALPSQSRAGLGRAELSRAGPGRAEPSRAEPSWAGPGRAKPGWAGPSPSRDEPSWAWPSRAEPGWILKNKFCPHRCCWYFFRRLPYRMLTFANFMDNVLRPPPADLATTLVGPAGASRTRAEPGQAEPSPKRAEPSRAELFAEPSRAEPGRAGPSPSRAEPSWAKPSRTEAGRVLKNEFFPSGAHNQKYYGSNRPPPYVYKEREVSAGALVFLGKCVFHVDLCICLGLFKRSCEH